MSIIPYAVRVEGQYGLDIRTRVVAEIVVVSSVWHVVRTKDALRLPMHFGT